MRIQLIGFLIGMQALAVNSFAGGHRNTLGRGAASARAESASSESLAPKGNAPGSERDDAGSANNVATQPASKDVGSRADDGAPMAQKGQSVLTISNRVNQQTAAVGAEVCFSDENGNPVTAAQIASGAMEGKTLTAIGTGVGMPIQCVVASKSETADVANRSVNPTIPSVSLAKALPGEQPFGCKPTVTTDLAAFGVSDSNTKYYYLPPGDLENLEKGKGGAVMPLVLFKVGGASGNQADANETQVASNDNVEKQNYIAQNGRPDSARGMKSRGRGAAVGGRMPAMASNGTPGTSNPNKNRCANIIGGGGGGGQGGNNQSAPGGAEKQGPRKI